MSTHPLIFEQSQPGKRAITMPKPDVPVEAVESLIPAQYLRRSALNLPEVSEIEAVRHFTNLSRRNLGIDVNFYPLGSCTMKYNPKINEDIARLPGIAGTHPMQDPATVQGNLELLWNMEQNLAEVTGMDRITFQPAAGAHGELTGLLMIRAYHQSRGDVTRKKVIVPDAAHGTNPATAAMVGYEVVVVPTNKRGGVDVDALQAAVGPDTAALMLTNPNTLGIFDENIHKITDIIHAAGGLCYYDGANLNATLGYARPGDMGFDVVHMNLHKTYSTPHGGGGPGAGPVGVKQILVPFLPVPVVDKQNDAFVLDYDRPQTIGKVRSFYGNFGVVARAYAYALAYGNEIKTVSEYAVLNANYILARLKEYYDLPYDRYCKHEALLSAKTLKQTVGVKTLDIAKRLLDEGMHAPTIYFPINVEEALLIEPTETEPKETLDRFIDAMITIHQEANSDPEKVKGAPYTTVVGRLDEALAARKPNLRYRAQTEA